MEVQNQQQESLIREMITYGANINIKDRDGDNLIMIIIRSHDEQKALNLIKVLTEASKGNLHQLLNDPKEAFDTRKGIAVIHLLVGKKFFSTIKYLKENAGLKLNTVVRFLV